MDTCTYIPAENGVGSAVGGIKEQPIYIYICMYFPGPFRLLLQDLGAISPGKGGPCLMMHGGTTAVRDESSAKGMKYTHTP